jgi:ornithine cyclodeaminase/alanine dehydrogenase-like protein (mu-crystallin family)
LDIPFVVRGTTRRFKGGIFMKILIINQSEVRQLLPMAECIDVMAQALKTLSRGQAILPLRPVMWLPEKVGALGMMPAYMDDLQIMGLKIVSVFPGNHGTEYDSHMGAVMIFETKHGQPLAIMDATEITAIRTAAVSGVATKLLAREGAGDLAILGSGTQARTHLDAMLLSRKIRRVRVWSRNPQNARQFSERESRRNSIAVDVMPTVQAAVQGADIICTTTSSPDPILSGQHLSAGAHINAVGSSVPFARELDTEAVVKSRLFVDRRESTVNEAGDFLIPKKEGVLGDSHIQGEIGEILLGKVKGRETKEEITLFKSLGLAVEDLASANHIYKKASTAGIGTLVELGGSRHES